MPLISGPDLGEMLKRARSDLHVTLMSGGAEREPAGSQLRLGLYSETLGAEEAGSNGDGRLAFARPFTTWRSWI
jgi:hypothetical protein